MKSESSSKPRYQRLVGLVVAATCLTGAIAVYTTIKFQQSGGSSESLTTIPQVKKVTALGRLEPASEVIQIAAPLTLNEDRIAQLLVEEGDRVEAQQVIAILDSRDRLKKAVKQAQEQVKVARSRFAQVQAGAKTGEIESQKAEIERLQREIAGETAAQNTIIARLEAEVRYARSEYDRFQMLYREGAIAVSTLDNKRLAVETTEAQLNEAKETKNRIIGTLQAQLNSAKATLDEIAEVRPVDLSAAQAEVDSAIATLKQAETDLRQAYIRAPIAGHILKIHARPGEQIPRSGIVDMGQIEQTIVVAEVYQTDIAKVQLGQQVAIASFAFSGELEGIVSHIGLQVNQQNVFSNEPGENLDRRVIDVKIRLNPEDSKRVAGLTNLQVQVAIKL